MNNLAIISIDGTIFYGFSSAARVLACNRQYLSYKAHKFKGNFTYRGRKVKVLNFMEIANYNSFEKRKKWIHSYNKVYRKQEKFLEYKREYEKTNRDHINERARNYYHEKKKRQLSTETEI